jgi:glycosyltransferase involved in cell wall biosynthesis
MNDSLTFVIDGFKQGGGQEVYKLLITAACKSHKKVNLIILETTDADIEIPLMDNLEIYKLSSKKFFDIREFNKFRNIISEINGGKIVSSFFKSHIWCAIAKKSNFELIWVEQNTYYTRTFFQWLLLRWCNRRVDSILCVSKEVLKFSAQMKLRNLRLSVNPINYSQSKIGLERKKNDFVFIGRMTEQKNPFLLLSSFKRYVLENGRDSNLHIVGDGDLLNRVKDFANELNIKDLCFFHGSLKIDETLKLLEETRTLISTSSIEGFGLARLEALACGCCVITTQTGGAVDFLCAEEDIGTFISEPSEQSISNFMHSSLTSKYWSNDLFERRKEIVKQFEPEKVLEDWLINPSV